MDNVTLRVAIGDHDVAGNLLANIPTALTDELTENLVVAKAVRIERIVSTGQSSPPDFWYDQNENEWVAVLQGEAELEFAAMENTATERKRLQAGDFVLIPAHQKHRVAWTTPDLATVWLAVFFS